VDSDDEQALLEALIDRVKPPPPGGGRFAGLHYLLSTPFRHPPLRSGSRFGARTERGLWYGALALPTAFAEVAYYRLLFLEGSAAVLPALTVELSSFEAAVATRRGVDLTRAPFAEYEAVLASPVDYAATQRVGREMRADGVEAFLFRSARDPGRAPPGRGVNVGLFEPVFARRRPSGLRTWICTSTRARVEVRPKGLLEPRNAPRFAFARAQFEVGGVLPAPAV
jgi:hypothetical protein